MKCHRNGCDSAACYHVGLELACVGGGRRQMIQAPTTLKVCRAHMHDAAAYVLSPLNKTNIDLALTGKGFAPPDFSSAELVFVPIKAAENDFGAAREAMH